MSWTVIFQCQNTEMELSRLEAKPSLLAAGGNPLLESYFFGGGGLMVTMMYFSRINLDLVCM